MTKIKLISIELFLKNKVTSVGEKTLKEKIIWGLIMLVSVSIFAFCGSLTPPNWGFYNAYVIAILGVGYNMWLNSDKMKLLLQDIGVMGFLLLSYYIFFVTEWAVSFPIKIVMGGVTLVFMFSYSCLLYFIVRDVCEKFIFAAQSIEKRVIKMAELIIFIVFTLSGWVYLVCHGSLYCTAFLSLCYGMAMFTLFRWSAIHINDDDVFPKDHLRFLSITFMQVALILIMQIFGFDNLCEIYTEYHVRLFVFFVSFFVYLAAIWMKIVFEYWSSLSFYSIGVLILIIFTLVLKPVLI